MIAALKPYPVYKHSGIEWLGEVPKHWEVKRGKALFRCVDVRSSTGEETLLTVSSERGVVPRSSATVTMFKAESYAGYKLCWPGDLVINSLWAWGRGLGVSRHHGIISTAYGVYRLRPPYTEYSAYVHALVRSTPFNWELQVRSKGIWISRLQLTDEAFLGAPVALPTLPEQAAIVRFLNHADRRIRRYIRAKQKLIALLKAQKQAILHEAVTGQTDVRTARPYRAYSSSSVEWLRDLPRRWGLRRLKDVAEVQTGLTLGKDYRSTQTVSRPYLRVANVQDGHLDLTQVKSIDVPLSEAERATLVNGDVLMTEGGDIDKLGRGAVWREEIPGCLHQNHIFAVRCRRGLLVPGFLVRLMESQHGRTYFELTAKRTTNLASTNSSTLRAFPVPLPAPEEQTELINAISEKMNALDTAIGRTGREIDLMREYGTRLIADVVTGKLDVREAAARLPDEVKELEPLDEADALIDGEEEPSDHLDAVPEEAEV